MPELDETHQDLGDLLEQSRRLRERSDELKAELEAFQERLSRYAEELHAPNRNPRGLDRRRKPRG